MVAAQCLEDFLAVKTMQKDTRENQIQHACLQHGETATVRQACWGFSAV